MAVDLPALPSVLLEAGVVGSYGDVVAEYNAVRNAAGVAEREDLAHLVLTGRDPVRMIQGLITSDLAGAAEGRVVYGAMLTPKGRVIAELRAWVEAGPQGPEVRILLPREVLAAAAEHLRRSVPPLYARWRDASEALGTVGVYGPRWLELLRAVLGGAIPELQEDDIVTVPFGEADVRIIGTRYAGGEPGADLVAERPALAVLRTALLEAGAADGARPVGFEVLETLRVEAGVPRGGHELTEEAIPTEAYEAIGMMERAISFTKGCYTGQEVIVRIAHRGHVNRHLRGLVLERPAPTLAGARLQHPDSGKEVGRITSFAHSPLLASTVALAFVRREVEPGSRVRIGEEGAGGDATVVALPFRRDTAD